MCRHTYQKHHQMTRKQLLTKLPKYGSIKNMRLRIQSVEGDHTQKASVNCILSNNTNVE